MDPRSGFSAETKTFHSLQAPLPLPPESQPLSVASCALSLLPSPLPSNPAFIDAATGAFLSYHDFLAQVRSLTFSLRTHAGIGKGHVAFVLSPTRFEIPVLYYALLSIGAVVSPASPLSTPTELSRLLDLTNPSILFTTSGSAHKVPSHVPTILLDSPLFQSFLSSNPNAASSTEVEVQQSDTAVILFSSGTTGLVKGVVVTHRSCIVGLIMCRTLPAYVGSPAVILFTIPLFHTYGFSMILRSIACGETAVLMERFELGMMLHAVQAHHVGCIPLAPPLMAALSTSEEASRYNLSSLRLVICGGAPLPRQVAERFAARFPHVHIANGYGITEAGPVSGPIGPEEMQVVVSVGRLCPNLEAMIVNPVTGEALPPGRPGELWLRGPTIMKGYIGDAKATASILDSKGWLKTGDVCYFNHDGFLFIVDRLKEMIKYKAYQVPPAELENILRSHPEIVDAAVIPYPHEEVGQIPMAYVVRQCGSTVTEEAVINFVAKQVAPYKKIRRVAFINSIPRSLAGKILRKELTEHALSSNASRL